MNGRQLEEHFIHHVHVTDVDRGDGLVAVDYRKEHCQTLEIQLIALALIAELTAKEAVEPALGLTAVEANEVSWQLAQAGEELAAGFCGLAGLTVSDELETAGIGLDGLTGAGPRPFPPCGPAAT